MRHGKKVNHLSRKTAHRKAMLANMASSLIAHKRINTTVAKAKALRVFVEPLITKSKTDDTHNRRVVFSYLRDKNAVTELFREVSAKVGDRPGGYTRIIKTGNRLGDNAEMCLIELVDFNEMYTNDKTSGAGKTRRSRRGKKKSSGETAVKDNVQAKSDNKSTDAKVPAVETAPQDEKAAETKDKAEPKKEEPKKEESKKEEPKAEASKETKGEAGDDMKNEDSKKDEKKD